MGLDSIELPWLFQPAPLYQSTRNIQNHFSNLASRVQWSPCQCQSSNSVTGLKRSEFYVPRAQNFLALAIQRGALISLRYCFCCWKWGPWILTIIYSHKVLYCNTHFVTICSMRRRRVNPQENLFTILDSNHKPKAD